MALLRCRWKSEERVGESRPALLDLKSLLFAAFLIASRLKFGGRFETLPVDPTALFALATCGMAVRELIQRGFRLPRPSLWIGPLWVLLAIPALWTDMTTGYAADKVLRLFTLTLVAGLAPFFLYRTRKDLLPLLNALALLGLFGGLQGMLVLLTGEAGHRLTAFGSGTISLARGMGMATVWIAILVIERYLIPPVLALGLLFPLAVGLLGAGSRGPLLGAIAAVILLGFLFYRRDRRQRRRVAILLITLCGVAAYGLSHAPDESAARLQSFAHGNVDHSAQLRIGFFHETWAAIQATPLGSGWGSFAREVLHETGEGGSESTEDWPHNIVLEVMLESGWLAGAYLILLLLVALSRAYTSASGPERRALFAFLVFLVVNALVSYDVNDNKLLFTFVALALIPDKSADEKRPLRIARSLTQRKSTWSGRTA